MGKKKQIEGNVVSIDMPVDEPVKKKKELSEKQRENLSKGMAILKAKREAKSKKEEQAQAQEQETPEIKVPQVSVPQVPVRETPSAQEPVAVVKKERKPRVAKNYLTTEDFNSFKTELLGSLKRPDHITPPPPQQVPISITTTPQVVKEIVRERVITGRELLDKIFFK